MAMFDYQRHFQAFCGETGLDIRLSFRMPPGYETANGTFDLPTETLYINAEYLEDAPDYKSVSAPEDADNRKRI